MQRIIRATPRPKYLRDIARNFVEKFLGGGDQMVAIHWRYNHGDWLQHCEKHPSPACTAVLEYVVLLPFFMLILFRTIGYPEEIAKQIASYVREHSHLKYLYIAAPLEEASLIENIRKGTAIKNIPLSYVFSEMCLVTNWPFEIVPKICRIKIMTAFKRTQQRVSYIYWRRTASVYA